MMRDAVMARAMCDDRGPGQYNHAAELDLHQVIPPAIRQIQYLAGTMSRWIG